MSTFEDQLLYTSWRRSIRLRKKLRKYIYIYRDFFEQTCLYTLAKLKFYCEKPIFKMSCFEKKNAGNFCTYVIKAFQNYWKDQFHKFLRLEPAFPVSCYRLLPTYIRTASRPVPLWYQHTDMYNWRTHRHICTVRSFQHIYCSHFLSLAKFGTRPDVWGTIIELTNNSLNHYTMPDAFQLL